MGHKTFPCDFLPLLSPTLLSAQLEVRLSMSYKVIIAWPYNNDDDVDDLTREIILTMRVEKKSFSLLFLPTSNNTIKEQDEES
jgi:hypothetical protein